MNENINSAPLSSKRLYKEKHVGYDVFPDPTDMYAKYVRINGCQDVSIVTVM